MSAFNAVCSNALADMLATDQRDADGPAVAEDVVGQSRSASYSGAVDVGSWPCLIFILFTILFPMLLTIITLSLRLNAEISHRPGTTAGRPDIRVTTAGPPDIRVMSTASQDEGGSDVDREVRVGTYSRNHQ